MIVAGAGHDGRMSEPRKTTRGLVSARAYHSALREMATRGTMRLTANQRQALVRSGRTGRTGRSAIAGRSTAPTTASRDTTTV